MDVEEQIKQLRDQFGQPGLQPPSSYTLQDLSQQQLLAAQSLPYGPLDSPTWAVPLADRWTTGLVSPDYVRRPAQIADPPTSPVSPLTFLREDFRKLMRHTLHCVVCDPGHAKPDCPLCEGKGYTEED